MAAVWVLQGAPDTELDLVTLVEPAVSHFLKGPEISAGNLSTGPIYSMYKMLQSVR